MRYRFLRCVGAVLALLFLGPGPLAAAEVTRVPIAYLSQVVEAPPSLSNLQPPPADEGVAGGRLAIADNNTTGRFLKQEFSLEVVDVPEDGDPVAAFQKLLADGVRLVVLDVPADALLAVADAAKDKGVLLLNAGAPDDRLRGTECREDILHIAPSRAMLADGLAQYLVWKRWRDWFLIVGQREGDRRLAEALRRAAKRFGAKIVEDKAWDFGPDARRTAQAEVPAFTQGEDHDVIVVADEIGEFGEYLAYRTWMPRPVVGTQGLVATSWHWTHERWGAVQLQNRFRDTFGRHMAALDYQVWAAVRVIGEAATRTGSGDPATVRDYVHSPEFELQAFKGQKLTFRSWDGQLRQPILLAAPKALVSVSPQDGFLHQHSLLDTMGIDEPESECER